MRLPCSFDRTKRSAVTQARLLDIAVREFGRKGLEGASTRSIAAAAGTAMSAITYHYGSKEGLYLAAADHIAAQIGAAMAGLGEDIPDDPVAARAALHAIVAAFVDAMVHDESADWALFIVREQTSPGDAFDRIYAGMMGETVERMVRLIERSTGVDARGARLAVVTTIGQVLVLRASRATVLRLLDVAALDAPTVAALKHRIARNIDVILNDLAAQQQEPQ